MEAFVVVGGNMKQNRCELLPRDMDTNQRPESGGQYGEVFEQIGKKRPVRAVAEALPAERLLKDDAQRTLLDEFLQVDLPGPGSIPEATLILGIVLLVVRYYIAVWLDTSISGSMAFATGIVFMTSFIGSPRHGLPSRYVRPDAVGGSPS